MFNFAPEMKKRMLMADAIAMLEGLEPKAALDNEVLLYDGLSEVQIAKPCAPVKLEFNAIVYCRSGKAVLEVGGSRQVELQAGMLLLVPAQKLLHPMMVSADVEVGVLFVSDRVLKSVLGAQVNIWNRAMYLNETYIVDARRWSDVLHLQSDNVFRSGDFALKSEFVLSFLRELLLIVCEELLRMQSVDESSGEQSTEREKQLFNQFLGMLQHEQQKRQQVSYYAEHLSITPKYLSTLCRNVSGKSPMKWITDSVMEDCYQLLRDTDITVKEISNRLGFPNSSFFGQYFREQAGMTPIEYRTKYRGKF